METGQRVEAQVCAGYVQCNMRLAEWYFAGREHSIIVVKAENCQTTLLECSVRDENIEMRQDLRKSETGNRKALALQAVSVA